MVCEFLAELCVLLLPILLLALVLVHLAEDGIFLVGLNEAIVSKSPTWNCEKRKVNIPRLLPHSRRSSEGHHSHP
jgi:hypothetical protein